MKIMWEVEIKVDKKRKIKMRGRPIALGMC